MKNIKDIWIKINYIFTKRQKRGLLLMIFIFLVEAILELSGIVSIYPFITVAMNQNLIHSKPYLRWAYGIFHTKSETDFLVLLAILLILIYLAKNLFNALAYYFRNAFVYNNQREIGIRLMGCYLNNPYTFFLEKNSSRLMRGVGTDVKQFFVLIMNCLIVFSNCLIMLTFGIFLLFTDFLLSISMMAAMVLFVFSFTGKNKSRSIEYGKLTKSTSGKMTQWLQQAFGGIKEIKILRRENFFVNSYGEYYATYIHVQKIFSFLNQIPHLVLECFCVVVLMALIVYRLIKGIDLTSFLPTLSVFAMALFRMFPKISQTNRSINNIIFSYPFLDSIYQDLKAGINYSHMQHETSPDASKPQKLIFKGSIILENVSFSYPNAKNNVLSGINMSIKKGQSIAFVGPSGAGKTTLADLILGILEATEGEIYCDGQAISSHIDEWLDMVGYIPQAIFLSDDTIRNNVAFGLKPGEMDDWKIWNALGQAQLKDFVMSLPEGLETQIGERGVRLSGGQRQRIGIARALYTNPEILVLDEATSALDNETEKAVMESIEHLLGHKTMIIIAHRITTVKHCDVIYRVNNESISEVSYHQLEKEMLERQA